MIVLLATAVLVWSAVATVVVAICVMAARDDRAASASAIGRRRTLAPSAAKRRFPSVA